MFSRRINPSKFANPSRLVGFALVVALVPGIVTAASFTMGPAVNYTEGDPAVTVLPEFALVDENQNYAGKDITFSLDGSYDPGESLALPDTVGGPSIVNNVISIQNGTIFKGNGTTAAAIGNVDGTLNGVTKNLKVNFTNAFTNGDFSNGSTGWSISNTRTYLGYADYSGAPVTSGATEIGGWPAPVDNLWGPGNSPRAGAISTINRDRAGITTTYSSSTGSGALTMTVGGASCDQGFCVIRGPHVISESSVYLAAGDQVSFNWQASASGDGFDVYGYLLNVATGKTLRLIDETGSDNRAASGQVQVTLGSTRDQTGYFASGTRRTDLITYNPSNNRVTGASSYDDRFFTDGTAVEAGAYKFVFVSGSYDDSGGQYLGASFSIDNITVSSSAPATVNAADIQAIARMLTYSNTNATDRTRTLSYASSIPDAGNTTTINVTSVNDAPVLAAITPATITDTSATDTFSNVTGTLSATDEEAGTITYGLSGASVSGTTATLTNALGTMSVDTTTGAFTFTPNNAGINALSANSSIVFTFTASDGNSSSTSAYTLNFVGVEEALPGAPVIDAVEAGDGSLSIEFTAPASAGTSPITNYQYSTDGVNYIALNPASTESPIEITLASDGVTPLANQTAYSITIRAVNATGASPSSNAVSGTPVPAPQIRSAPLPTPTASPTARPTPRPTTGPGPRPSVAPALPTPAPSAPASELTPEQIADQVRDAQIRLVLPVRPETSVAEFLIANPEVGALTEQGYVAVNPTQSLAITDGIPEAVELFPNDSQTGYIVQGSDFSLSLAAETSDGTPIEMDSEGRIILSPAQSAQVEGIGFSPNTTVVIWMFSEPQKLGEMTTNSQGSFEGSVPIPADLAVGEHTIQINGVTKNGETRSVSLGVVVQAPVVPAALPPVDGLLNAMWLFALVLAFLGMTFWLIAWRRRKQREARPQFAS